jgi:hypothetical protein
MAPKSEQLPGLTVGGGPPAESAGVVIIDMGGAGRPTDEGARRAASMSPWQRTTAASRAACKEERRGR